jgi:hypothetical protein
LKISVTPLALLWNLNHATWFQAAKQKVIDERVQKMRKEDWFERYMKMAQAMYDLDDSGSGRMGTFTCYATLADSCPVQVS